MKSDAPEARINDLESKPSSFVTESTKAFLEACGRERRGDYVVHSLKAGKRHGDWIWRVTWKVDSPVNNL